MECGGFWRYEIKETVFVKENQGTRCIGIFRDAEQPVEGGKIRGKVQLGKDYS